MSEVTVRPPPPAFPRSSSLYIPDLAHSTPSLLGSSYSPFPEFPGSKSDPLNLNRFLACPNDASWMLHLVPSSDSLQLAPSHSEPLKVGSSSRSFSKKTRSNSMLYSSSPLSRSPIGGETVEVEGNARSAARMRSNSVDSIPSPKADETDLPEPFPESAVEMKKGSVNKKTLRSAFQFRRKSLLSLSDQADTPKEDSTTVGQSSTSSITSLASDDSVPSTPLSSRTSSTYSELSSASSLSSCDGLQTPAEVDPRDDIMEAASGKLAIALAAAEDGSSKKSGWRGWLGGRRSSKITPFVTPSVSYTSGEPHESSPINSTIVLAQSSQSTLPVSTEVSRSSSPLSTDSGINRTLAMEQTRRISIRKLGQLRAPSPHPLALALKRQYSNLPDEIASSIQSGQKVFPRSVNAVSSTPGGLSSSQGGMFSSLCVMHVLRRLEKGESPELTLTARRASDPMTLPRPNGVRDFIKRPPYEERNLVFFANGTCSPISMARPGYGVWDLDFSPYILALSTVDTIPSTPWPILPRASLGPTDAVAGGLTLPEDETASPGSEPEEVLISPSPVVVKLADESDDKVQPAEVSASSFRAAAALPQPWQESSDEEEEDEGEDEDEDDDDSPLSSIILSKRTASNVDLAAVQPAISHSRSKSSPTAKRVSIVEDPEAKQRKMLDEVARARDRRRANLTGELERRAEAQTRRPRIQTNRHSTAGDDGQIKRSSGRSSSTPALQDVLPQKESARDSRRRTQSSYELPEARPSSTRTTSAPEGGLMSSKRYHSFYELPQTSRSPPRSPAPVAPQRPQMAHIAPQAFMPPMFPTFTHPAMQVYPAMSPGMSTSPSMTFPAGYMQPMGMPAMHQQPMMGFMPQPISPPFLPQQSPPMYLQMQGRGNRSSLSVPDARHRGPNGTHQGRQHPSGSHRNTGWSQ